ncbi:MAG: hypothetical protein IPM59_04225 [Chloracidobacterium sp.]|nr:hypothetical protein [Chloracidobacterium sp.]
MKNRVFAEEMEKSVLWQVVHQNPATDERFIVKKDMAKQEARDFAQQMQAAINKSDENEGVPDEN